MAFNVGDGVFAVVSGFDPFPAVVESVVFNESLPCVYYHVKLLGSTQVVALDAENLLPFEENKGIFRLNYSTAELEDGARMRETVLLGKEDEFPEVLMNFVTVDDQFDEVSTEDMKRLGLSNIILSASDLIKNLENVSLHSHLEKNSHPKLMEDELIDIEGIESNGSQAYHLKNESTELVPFSCNNCFKNFQTMSALRKHKQRNVLCKNTEVKTKLVKKSNVTKQEIRKTPMIGTAKRKKRVLMKARRSHAHVTKSKTPSNVKTLSNVDPVNVLSSDDSSPEEKCTLKHNVMERERRAELAKRFAELSDAIGLGGLRELSKVAILAAAKAKIAQLLSEDSKLRRQMTEAKDINLRLNARLMSLSGHI